MAVELLTADEKNISYHRSLVENGLTEFLTANNLKFLIGVSGGADEVHLGHTQNIVSGFLAELRNVKIGILTGGTQGGIPELATTIAKDYSIPTVGVFPRDGRKYALWDKLDLVIETLPPSFGSAGFGTETPTYVELINGLVVIGGEFGTLVEVATVLKNNKSRLKKGRPLIYLCPIKGTGGMAEIIDTLPAIKIVRESLPEQEVISGEAAARFLRRKLLLDF